MRLIAILIGCVLSLTGCSGSIKDSHSKSGDIQASQPENLSPHQEFVSLVMQKIPNSDISTLPALGDTICEALPSLGVGLTMEVGIETGYSANESGFLVGAASGTICPEHMSLVQEYLEGP